jgi:TPR repeat protein
MRSGIGLGPARAFLGAAILLVAFLLAPAPVWAGMSEAWDAYDRGDYDTAAQLFRVEADHGDSEAQYMLGVMYANSMLGPRDPADAARWYQKAADQGHPDAEDALGYLYDFGLGVPHDDTKAEALYRRAAEGGSVNGKNNLAFQWAAANKNLDQALAYAREVTAALPKEGAYQDTLGWVLYRLHRYVEALPPLCRAAKLNPASPEIHAHLGDAYWHLGLKANAQMQWQQAFELADRPQLLDDEGQDFLYAEGATFRSGIKARLAGGPGDGPAPAAADPASVSQLVGGDCELPTS